MNLKDRFRKYLPVVVDLETGGFDPIKNAILEIAITLIEEKDNQLVVGETFRHHIEPFEGLIVEKESLEFTKINLNHHLYQYMWLFQWNKIQNNQFFHIFFH